MTISYSCEADVSNVTIEDLTALAAKLDAEHYDWAIEDGTLTLDGETEVDSYDTNADDVARDINYILWSTANLDADIETKEVEYEPDWDAMPGGYDAIWN